MMVLVDTSIWSLALRRRKSDLSRQQHERVQNLEQVIAEGRARLLGAVRQEVLSGIKSAAEFLRLREQLRAFPDVALEIQDYEDAAKIGNECRSHGIAVTPIDMLLCSVALRRDWAIYTSDRDFERYAKCAPIVLFALSCPRRAAAPRNQRPHPSKRSLDGAPPHQSTEESSVVRWATRHA